MYDLPTLINWTITNRCNLNCGFCFKLNDEELKFNNKKNIINKIIQSGIKRITITGGEPTLVNELEYIANCFKSNGIFTSIHTNGTNSQLIKEIYKNFDRISLSLDSNNEEGNYQMRGNSAYFNTILDLIYFLKDKQQDLVIKTLATKKNYVYIPEMATLIDVIRPSFWSIFEFRPIRRGLVNQEEFLLLPGEFLKMVETINTNTTINTMSAIEAATYPIFLISANGGVYTNDIQKGDIYIDSILTKEVSQIWSKIIKKNLLTAKHLEKYKIITENTKP